MAMLSSSTLRIDWLTLAQEIAIQRELAPGRI